MKLKQDHTMAQLRQFGFHCDEKTADGFLRYSRRIGNLLITIANGQFENKIRTSMLQDKDGHIRTTIHDLNAYTDLIGAMAHAGMLQEERYTLRHDTCEQKDPTVTKAASTHADYDMNENPLVSFPKKPEGFMAQ